MDINALLSTILSNESVSGVAAKAGVGEKEVKSVLGSALPMLLSGANAQSNDAATAQSFAGALDQHAQSDTSSIGAFLQNVDMADGAKIISHLLGASEKDQTADFAARAGLSPLATGSILALAAPLLMSLLGKQTAADENKNEGVSALMGNLLGGGDVAGIISGLLGTDGGKKKKGLGILGMLLGKRR